LRFYSLSFLICSGTSVEFTTTPTNGGTPSYQWKKGGIDIPGETGATYTTTTLSNGNVITVEMTSSLSCATGSPVTSNGIIITVTPDNTVLLSSAVGTDGQTKCINTAITNITYTTTGATGATFSGLPAGLNGNWSSNTVTISGTPTSAGTFNYASEAISGKEMNSIFSKNDF